MAEAAVKTIQSAGQSDFFTRREYQNWSDKVGARRAQQGTGYGK
jgi:hypothetical protein